MVIDNETGDVTEGGAQPGAPAPVIEALEVPAARSALVTRWIKDIKAAKTHHEKAFKRMRVCMKLAAHGTTDTATAEAEDGSVVVPITNRLVNQAVASLYAKNPKAVAKRKDKLLYTLWDGDPASLKLAMESVAVAMQQAMAAPPMADPMTGEIVPAQPQIDPNAAALLQEIQEAKQTIVMYDRMAKTLQLLFAYFLDEQDSGYKEQFKAMVRRAKVCGVAYVELGFQRTLQKDPDVSAQIADTTSQIVAVEAGLQGMKDRPDDYDAESAKLEELRLLIATLQAREEIIVREGPVLSFPRSTMIIPDKSCEHLKTFAGARWVAREFHKTAEEIQEIYGKDIKGRYTAYKSDGTTTSEGAKEDCGARLWRVQDKRNQQTFVVCDGYPDFLVEPAEPDVKIERFWTLFPLVLNEIEHEDEIFPPSDVWNSRHMQREYNMARQGLREHRIAARPGWVTTKGKLEAEDKTKLSGKKAFDIIELASLTPGEDVAKLLQSLPLPGVDPNMYETETTFTDLQRSVGVSDATLGGTSGDTATESSIAEHSRSTSNSSDVDDLDTVLTALARAMGQLLFLEMSKETVVEIAGPGAVWPDAPPTREQVVKDLVLQTEAGSSGRPNQAAEAAKFERAMPWLSIIPGINPIPLAKKGLGLLDIDLEEAIVEGAPSITAMNQMAGQAMQGGGGPDDPNAQGDKGGQNAKNPQDNEQGSQPAYPAPMPV